MQMGIGNDALRMQVPGQMPCRIFSPIQGHQTDILFTKRREDMPSDEKMLFFTPQLYQRFNSQDEAEALAADAEWETAIARYDAHLQGFSAKMSSQVAELSRLSLHDAEILVRREEQHPVDSLRFADDYPFPPPFWPNWYGAYAVAAKLDNEVVMLFYFLLDHVREQPAPQDWPFSKRQEHWLYDELHWQGSSRWRFTHLILLSTGIVLSIPFSTVSITRIPLALSDEGGKQSA